MENSFKISSDEKFAKRYAGKRFQIFEFHTLPYLPSAEGKPDRSLTPFCRLVGWHQWRPGADGINMVVEMEDEIMRMNSNFIYAYTKFSQPNFVIPREELKTPIRIWTIPVKNLRLIEQEIKQRPYPRICKLCKMPARDLNEIKFCSNSKCSSRKLFKKVFKNVLVKLKYITCHWLSVNGQTCKLPIVCITLKNRAAGLVMGNCKNKHISHYQLRPNDAIYASYYPPNKDLIWDGNQFSLI